MDPYSLVFLILDAGHLAAVVAEEDPPVSNPVAISTQKIAAVLDIWPLHAPWAGWNWQNLVWARDQHRELRTLPGSGDVGLLPPKAVCEANRDAAWEGLRYWESLDPWFPDGRVKERLWLQRARYDVWTNAVYAHGESVIQRRRCLGELRSLIGVENYVRGQLPGAVE